MLFFYFFQKSLDKIVYTVYTIHIQYIRDEQRGEIVNIFIDNKSGVPIYDQIYKQIKQLIISGELSEDDMLPSIRNLAKDLGISVITTKRAYEELEKEGFIYMVAAKGCFVAPKNVELIREETLKRIEGYLQEIVQLSKACRLTKEDIIEMFNIIMEEE